MTDYQNSRQLKGMTIREHKENVPYEECMFIKGYVISPAFVERSAQIIELWDRESVADPRRTNEKAFPIVL